MSICAEDPVLLFYGAMQSCCCLIVSTHLQANVYQDPPPLSSMPVLTCHVCLRCFHSTSIASICSYPSLPLKVFHAWGEDRDSVSSCQEPAEASCPRICDLIDCSTHTSRSSFYCHVRV